MKAFLKPLIAPVSLDAKRSLQKRLAVPTMGNAYIVRRHTIAPTPHHQLPVHQTSHGRHRRA
jgi:hypothetical protein